MYNSSCLWHSSINIFKLDVTSAALLSDTHLIAFSPPLLNHQSVDGFLSFTSKVPANTLPEKLVLKLYPSGWALCALLAPADIPYRGLCTGWNLNV